MEIYLLHNGKSFALQSWFAPPCPTPCSSPSCAIQLAAFHLMQRPKDVRKQGGQDPGTLGSFSQVERRVLNFFARIPFVFFCFPSPARTRNQLYAEATAAKFMVMSAGRGSEKRGKSGGGSFQGWPFISVAITFIYFSSFRSVSLCAGCLIYWHSDEKASFPSFPSQWVRKVVSRAEQRRRETKVHFS